MFLGSLLLGSSFFSPFAFFASSTHATATDSPAQLPTSPYSVDAHAQSQVATLSQHSIARRDPDPATNKFLEPGPPGVSRDFSNNTAWIVDSQTIEVSWISEWQSVDLSLCQPTNGESIGCYLIIQATLSKGFHWQAENETNHMSGFQSQPVPNVYYFKLTPTNTQTPAIMSHYFNITKGSNDTSDGGGSGSVTGNGTTTAANATNTEDPTATETGTSTTSATPTGSGASSNTSGSRLSVQAQIAIYVVAGMVASGLIVAASFCLVLRSRKRKRAARLAKIEINESTSTISTPIPLQEMHSDSYVHETGTALPHEIASREVPMELPAEIPGLAVSRYDEDDEWDDASVDGRSVALSHVQPHDHTH